MTDLINRLENAVGADRELDLLIWAHFGGWKLVLQDDQVEWRAEKYDGDVVEEWTTVAYDDFYKGRTVSYSFEDELPEYTASLNTCQALEQELFPHSEHQISNLHSFSHVGVCLNMESPAYGTCKFGDEPYRTCRAWLAALLKAKDTDHE